MAILIQSRKMLAFTPLAILQAASIPSVDRHKTSSADKTYSADMCSPLLN